MCSIYAAGEVNLIMQLPLSVEMFVLLNIFSQQNYTCPLLKPIGKGECFLLLV